MATEYPNDRIRTEWDDSPDLSYLDQPYDEVGPFMIPAFPGEDPPTRALTADEAAATLNNPDHYNTIVAFHERRCGRCGQWEIVDVCGGFDQYDGPTMGGLIERDSILRPGCYDLEEVPGYIAEHFEPGTPTDHERNVDAEVDEVIPGPVEDPGPMVTVTFPRAALDVLIMGARDKFGAVTYHLEAVCAGPHADDDDRALLAAMPLTLSALVDAAGVPS